MKGMLFISFLDLVESQYGPDTLEVVLSEGTAENSGVYIAAGDYPHTELIALIVSLSKHTGIEVSHLIKSFGMYHFAEFIDAYPQLFTDLNSCFALLEKVDSFIHQEVRLLYPGATPPKFDYHRVNEDTIELLYQSPRCMGDVAEGLILGCAAYYGEKIGIKRERHGDKSGALERFTITR
ncbi:MAG: heme NO-binding domain-containing protein [Porticoccaceae bacterium]|nr:heme NO-binding domain-containing protein [Porticoccaceae bacterium]